MSWSGGTSNAVLRPIEKMNVSNGDPSLFFISSNGVAFILPCNDPVFSAHREVFLTTGGDPLYFQDKACRSLGLRRTGRFSLLHTHVSHVNPIHLLQEYFIDPSKY